jgi:hypothetical protein
VHASRTLFRSVKSFVARRWLPLTASVVSVALVASLGTWWVIRFVEDQAEAVDCSVLEADGFGDASSLARACEADVEVRSERTPWQTSWAAPDGAARLEAAAAPVRTEVDGEWMAVDDDLVVTDDGGIEVAAPVFPMRLNPGGGAGFGQPLGMIERDDHTFKLWFPLDLPVGEVDGSKVVYQIDDGIRLITSVNVDTTGFLPVVELADPSAAERFADLLEQARGEDDTETSGMALDFDIEVSEGLTVAVDEMGQTSAVDAAGETQFFAPPPTMWDSSGAAQTFRPTVTEVGPGDRTVSPSDGDVVAPMGAAIEGSTLIITPDPAMLTSPETVWPVYIDPQISGKGAAERIAVRKGDYTSTLYNWTNISSSSPGQGTGYCSQTSSCNVVFYQRLLWEFTGLSLIAGLDGSDIQSAQFRVNGVHSYNCTAYKTTLYRTGAISASSTWSSVSWLQTLGSRTESQRSSCSPSTNGWKNFTATQAFVWAADANSSVVALGLRVDEASMSPWKRFAHDATITVTYNREPDVPTGLQLTDPNIAGCVTGETRPVIANATPTLSAIGSDPDLSTVLTSFEIVALSDPGVPVWSSGNLTALPSGTRASKKVDAGKLTTGVTYAWRARGFDGTLYGAWSGWCEFTLDTAPPPGAPTVTAVDTGVPAWYPENQERGGVGLTGQFILSRNSSTDVVRFKYWFDDTNLPETATPDANGLAVIDFPATTAGPVTLTVKMEDAAGNSSPARNYTFIVATPTEDAVWSLDEGTGSTSHDSAGTPPRDLTISGATWGDGPHALFDSREGDYALEFDGVDDYARAESPVLDTRESFVVSAHVVLDPSRVGQPESLAVLSQTGVDNSGFRLEFSGTCAGMPDGCWSFSMPDSGAGTTETTVVSDVPVRAGEWTHLIAEYDEPGKTMRLWVCEIGTPANPAIGEPIVAEVARPATPWAAASEFRIGHARESGAYTGYWHGAIDNIRVFTGEIVAEAKIRRLCQGAEATDFSGDWALDPTNSIGG